MRDDVLDRTGWDGLCSSDGASDRVHEKSKAFVASASLCVLAPTHTATAGRRRLLSLFSILHFYSSSFSFSLPSSSIFGLVFFAQLTSTLLSPHFPPPQNSFFKTLIDQTVTVELKNDIKITGTLKSVDQYLNIKLDDISVHEELNYPHLSAVKNVFIRGSVVRYVHLPSSAVDVTLLEDAARRGTY